jgi:hypothetical protein
MSLSSKPSANTAREVGAQMNLPISRPMSGAASWKEHVKSKRLTTGRKNWCALLSALVLLLATKGPFSSLGDRALFVAPIRRAERQVCRLSWYCLLPLLRWIEPTALESATSLEEPLLPADVRKVNPINREVSVEFVTEYHLLSKRTRTSLPTPSRPPGEFCGLDIRPRVRLERSNPGHGLEHHHAASVWTFLEAAQDVLTTVHCVHHRSRTGQRVVMRQAKGKVPTRSSSTMSERQCPECGEALGLAGRPSGRQDCQW